jgi:antiviral immunity YobI-like NTPase
MLFSTFLYFIMALNEIILKSITWIKEQLTVFERRFAKDTRHSNALGYEDLTPIDNVENSRAYEDALLFALKNNRSIRNIAITGPYGSGKSSIIKTFENNHKEYKFLNISLASFVDKKEPADDSNGNEQLQTEQNRLIEVSILQQMFYRVKGQDIPDSRFTRIHNLNKKQIISWVVAFLLGLFATTIIFNPYFISKLSFWKNIYKSHSDALLIISIAINLAISVRLFVYFLRLLNNSKFQKLNITKGEIELGPKGDTSILNKHLDEILYFFEVTKFNVVVIEDLDRFDSPEIFTKLRELNILINNSDQVNRHIVFIYSIRDDMFTDKTRTKFFDFIIPIIPVINSSNSLDMILRKINSPNIANGFLSDIALYVDDMRLLKNILNEFILYKENLKSISLREDKLLAMITYKNAYPNDFASLHKNEGIVYNMFASKPILIENSISKNLKEIGKIEEKIKKINATNIDDLDELVDIYLANILKAMPEEAIGLNIRGQHILFSKLNDDKYFETLSEDSQKILQYIRRNPTHHYSIYDENSNTTFGKIEQKINKNYTYKERKDLIDDKNNNIIKSLQNKMAELNEEISKLKSKSLSEVLKLDDDNFSLLPVELKSMKVLAYFIREGFIDEMYSSYISYFYEGTLSINDKKFLMSIKDRESIGFEYKLERIGGLFRWLSLYDFETPAMLNFDMLNYLIDNKKRVLNKMHLQECCNVFFQQLCNKSEISIKFIDEYTRARTVSKDLLSVIVKDEILTSVKESLETARQEELLYFINEICRKWSGFWDHIDLESKYSKERKDEFLKQIIMFADLEDIKMLNGRSTLSQYISHSPDFLTLIPEHRYFQKMLDVIKILDIKFEEITYPNPTNILFDYVYDTDRYMINEKMIELILRTKSTLDSDSIDALVTSNYTIIQKSSCQNIILYLSENIETYLTDVFLKIETNTKESEESVIYLLGREKIPKELKEKIIEKQAILFTDIRNLDSEFWDVVFKSNKVFASWVNIIEYFKFKRIPSYTIINYINQKWVYEKLFVSGFVSDKSIDPEILHDVVDILILYESISDECFEQITAVIPYKYDDLAFENLSANKIKALVKNKIIRLSPENYARLKNNENYASGKYVALIENDIDSYLKDIGNYKMDAGGYIALLKSKKLKPDQELTVALNVTPEIIDEKIGLETLIENVYIEHAYQNINYDILKKIIECSHSLENIIKIIINNLDNQDENKIQALLIKLREPYSELVINAKNIIIPRSDLNKALIEKLKANGYISTYEEEKEILKINFEYPLEIIKATYGTAENEVDVTDKVKQLVINNKFTVTVTNDIVGGDENDPVRGVLKILKILYKIREKETIAAIKEGETFTIPEE